MDWIELSTRAEAEAVESIAELFSALGHGGVAVEETLAEGAEPGRVEIDPTALVLVKTYLPDEPESKEKIQRAESAIWHLSQLRRIEPLKVTKVVEEDWAEAWKEFFHVQHIGERTTIKPTWREYEARPGEVIVELDPGMAFGTGLHPTTRMCLRGCERYVQEGMKLLDLGTGSAILAIAAAKLGASSVLALDVDPVAVDSAAKNVDLNKLSDKISVRQGSTDYLAANGKPQFDLVLANIIARVLVELSQDIHDALLPGGLVITSGIIAEREEEVRVALAATGLEIVEVVSEGDWRSVVCRRGDA